MSARALEGRGLLVTDIGLNGAEIISLVTRRAFLGPSKSIRAADGGVGRTAGGAGCVSATASTAGMGFLMGGLARRGGLGLDVSRPASSRRGEEGRLSGERTASRS
jgi:hypothetical protein